jgi:hypothetical protein
MEMHYKNHNIRKMTNQLVDVQRRKLEDSEFLTFDLD